jgi:hypothetical protein
LAKILSSVASSRKRFHLYFTQLMANVIFQWTSHCDHMKLVRDHLYDSLLDECEHRMKMGQGTGSYMENILSHKEQLGLSRNEISFV